MKKILIINTRTDIKPLYDFFETLDKAGHALSLRSFNVRLIDKFKENSIQAKKIFKWPDKLGFFSLPLFVVLIPFNLFFVFFYLLILKFNNKISTVILFSPEEKILFTPAAKLLMLKIIWFECPADFYMHPRPLLVKTSRFFSAWAINIAVTATANELLANYKYTKNLKILNPGIKLKRYRQENIFARIAEEEKRIKNNKFFSVGTVISGNNPKIETLFKAARDCLSVIPSLQIIIIGGEKEKQNLTWLAKKLEIDYLVWFMGSQKYLKKWLQNLDIYVVATDRLTINDYKYTLEAQVCKIATIGFGNIGLDSIIENNNTGVLLGKDSSDELAQAIINLYKNKQLRHAIAKAGHEQVIAKYSVEKMAEEFIDLIKTEK